MYKPVPHFFPLAEVMSNSGSSSSSSSNSGSSSGEEEEEEGKGHYLKGSSNEIEVDEKDLYCPLVINGQGEEEATAYLTASSGIGLEKCNKRVIGVHSDDVCNVWRKEYVDINLTSMNLEKLLCKNGSVMIRSRNTAPILMHSAETFMAFVMWLVSLLRTHVCIEQLDLALSEVVFRGVCSKTGNREVWESIMTQCDAANKHVATAVFSMHRLTHLRMRGFEFVYHSELYAPCLWQNMSVLDYWGFVGTVTIPLVRVRDCVRFVDCRCVHLARLRHSPISTLVLDKVVLSDNLCSDLASCCNLRYLALGSWIGNCHLPAPLSQKSISLWVDLCERLMELRVLNMNQLTDVAFLKSNISVLNCRGQMSVAGFGARTEDAVVDEGVVFDWVRRSIGATTRNCHVRINCKQKYNRLVEVLASVGVQTEFLTEIEQMLKCGTFPLSHARKLTLRPRRHESNRARVTKAQFKTNGKDGRSVTVELDLKKYHSSIFILYDRLITDAKALDEVSMELPISLCVSANMAAHFETVATQPTIRTFSTDTPVLCGCALRELLTCLAVAENEVTNLHCNMYISSVEFAHYLAEMLRCNTKIESVRGVIFRKSHFVVAVSTVLLDRQPPLKEFAYTVRNRGSWSDEYCALSNVNKIINRVIPTM